MADCHVLGVQQTRLTEIGQADSAQAGASDSAENLYCWDPTQIEVVAIAFHHAAGLEETALVEMLASSAALPDGVASAHQPSAAVAAADPKA